MKEFLYLGWVTLLSSSVNLSLIKMIAYTIRIIIAFVLLQDHIISHSLCYIESHSKLIIRSHYMPSYSMFGSIYIVS